MLLLIGWQVARIFKPITTLVNAKPKENAYNFDTPNVETALRKKLLRHSSNGDFQQVCCPVILFSHVLEPEESQKS